MTDSNRPCLVYYSPRSIKSKRTPTLNPSSPQLLPKLTTINRKGGVQLNRKLSSDVLGPVSPLLGKLPPLKLGGRILRESPIVSDRRDDETFDKDLFSMLNRIRGSDQIVSNGGII